MLGLSSGRPSVRLWALASAASLVAVLLAGPATSADQPPPPPDSHRQSLEDGCQRSNGMDLTLTTPEWVYVNRSQVLADRLAGSATAGRQTVEGVVDDIHPAGDDL